MRFSKLIFLHLQHLPMPSLGWRSRVCRWGGVNILNPRKTEIGTNVVFDTMAPENITIEEGVIISTGCKIISHYFDPKKVSASDRLANRYEKGCVVIKKNVFIGMGSLIIKPVTIGENAIVGAGSVVTHDIPANEIWAGNPARRIDTI